MITDIASFDCVYLSYDEPMAEENWAKINSMVPWAVRVHGVKGIDAAHKAAASASQTERFILIDGDNIPDYNFFNQSIDIPEKLFHCVFRWKARNAINALTYGNGGLSCWTRTFIYDMKTHELGSNLSTAVEFCWEDNYLSMHDTWSTTYPNGSALQAFKAGFREGVKLFMDRGVKPSLENFEKETHPLNMKRLKQWMTIGADVENGIYAMQGARIGAYLYMSGKLDVDINDSSEFLSLLNNYTKDSSFLETSSKLIKNLFGWDLPNYDAAGSKFFKEYLPREKNIGLLVTEQEYNRNE